MKKNVFIIILLLVPFVSYAETHFLKLRASHHPGFLRIVLEGEKQVVSSASVYQRGQDVVVSFPDISFAIQSEKTEIDYKKVDRHTVMFSPGDFIGLKVITLEHPSRLVIDVYIKARKRAPVEIIDTLIEKKKTDPLKGKTVVIDPGHGGYEYGLVKESYIEKNVVLDIARKFSALLNRGSHKGVLTRGSDRFMAQSERVRYSNREGADIFVSLHIGNHSNIIIYVPVVTDDVSDVVKPHLANKGQDEYINDTIVLLRAMKEAVKADFGDDMVDVRPLPYSILSKIEAAALMIELPSFEDAYYVDDYRAEIADTLYKGIYIYEEIKTR